MGLTFVAINEINEALKVLQNYVFCKNYNIKFY